jgi:hypothetical protein
MVHRCQSIYFGFTAHEAMKKAGTKFGPGVELAGCPDKIVAALPLPFHQQNPRQTLALSGPSRPHRQIPHLSQNAGHLHPVQLLDKRQNLRDELIFHQFADFVLTVLFTATEQFRHGHLQGSRQPFQGRQRRRSFLVFDLGNVCPRY